MEPLNQANGQVATTAPAARPTHRSTEVTAGHRGEPGGGGRRHRGHQHQAVDGSEAASPDG